MNDYEVAGFEALIVFYGDVVRNVIYNNKQGAYTYIDVIYGAIKCLKRQNIINDEEGNRIADTLFDFIGGY